MPGFLVPKLAGVEGVFAVFDDVLDPSLWVHFPVIRIQSRVVKFTGQ